MSTYSQSEDFLSDQQPRHSLKEMKRRYQKDTSSSDMEVSVPESDDSDRKDLFTGEMGSDKQLQNCLPSIGISDLVPDPDIITNKIKQNKFIEFIEFIGQ